MSTKENIYEILLLRAENKRLKAITRKLVVSLSARLPSPTDATHISDEQLWVNSLIRNDRKLIEKAKSLLKKQ
jgi:hypothetical protein